MESPSKKNTKAYRYNQGFNTAISTLTETIISLQATVTKQPPIVSQHPNDMAESKTVDRSMNIVAYGIEESPLQSPGLIEQKET